eukprot:CAMPEP_0119156956 /NCGR_PEP_ID=MMETSP1310-20130426/52518_1 /TAXON_ID=464262 /ORGANISM="Genus nov. species nov., Strain RCC2339" /LENGTH=223 /DNA_ID=CAMNT_0007149571 /DNA_START=76 /DNA_END=747 /DNA_ORIENTATION=-
MARKGRNSSHDGSKEPSTLTKARVLMGNPVTRTAIAKLCVTSVLLAVVPIQAVRWTIDACRANAAIDDAHMRIYAAVAGAVAMNAVLFGYVVYAFFIEGEEDRSDKSAAKARARPNKQGKPSRPAAAGGGGADSRGAGKAHRTACQHGTTAVRASGRAAPSAGPASGGRRTKRRGKEAADTEDDRPGVPPPSSRASADADDAGGWTVVQRRRPRRRGGDGSEQ